MEKSTKKFEYHIIYETKNNINNKIYVGKHSTYDLNDGYMGSGTLLKPAFAKYGKEQFTRTILHSCSSEHDAMQLEAEIVDAAFVARTDTYNLTLGGRGIQRHTTSAETRAKISKGNTGKICSIEHKEKISIGNKGRVVSPDTRAKISVFHKGRIKSADECLKISNSNKGKVISDDAKMKMSAIKTGKTQLPETRDKISEALKGNKSRTGQQHSPETKAKMKEAWIKRKANKI